MCPLVHHSDARRAVEDDEGEVRQVDGVDLRKDLLPRAGIWCRQFLLVEGVQGMIAVEVSIASIGRELVTREQRGIVGVMSHSSNTESSGSKPFQYPYSAMSNLPT